MGFEVLNDVAEFHIWTDLNEKARRSTLAGHHRQRRDLPNTENYRCTLYQVTATHSGDEGTSIFPPVLGSAESQSTISALGRSRMVLSHLLRSTGLDPWIGNRDL